MKTKDYTIFRNIDGNRKINQGHVTDLVEAIDRKNLLEYFPVLVNEKMEIIDGQHRLSAAIQLQIDIPYAQVHGLKIEDVMQINTNSKSWAMKDFIDSWITLDKPDYKILKTYYEKYKINPSTAVRLLKGSSYAYIGCGGRQATALIRSGNFKVSSLGYAEKIADQLVILRKYTDFEPTRDRELIGAVMRINANPIFDFDKFISKLKLHNLSVEKRPSEKYYILHIEELYNFKNSSKVTELYESTYKNIVS